MTAARQEGTGPGTGQGSSPAPAEERVHHPIFARLYLRMTKSRKSRGEDEHRRRLLAGLSGRVIEVGAGNGLNFDFYPESVTEVIAVEPEATLREAALQASREAPVKINVVDGVSGRLPVEDGSCDAGVASLVLCSVPDQARALAELRRVIRPGGELRFYEHVVSQRGFPARLQRLADATFWPRVGGGCHMSRDTTKAIEEAGFAIERRERFPFSPGAPVPALAHVLGVARRPESDSAP
jgi:ubiquinone/menaquinone biosynthesis C-methylase UbiE